MLAAIAGVPQLAIDRGRDPRERRLQLRVGTSGRQRSLDSLGVAVQPGMAAQSGASKAINRPPQEAQNAGSSTIFRMPRRIHFTPQSWQMRRTSMTP